MRVMDADWDRLTDAIQRRRNELGLTQVQLAEAAGVTDTTIRNLEGGRKFRRLPASVPAVEQALGWAPGSARIVLDGGEPIAATQPAERPQPQPQDTLAGLPASVLDELNSGDVYATEIHDLSQEGGITIITVGVRRPGEPGTEVSPEQRRRNFRAWSRIQRRINGLPPLEWEPGDPEEWKEDTENK